MVMYDSTDFSYLPIDDKVESVKRKVLSKCCTYYNTPENLSIVYLIKTSVIKLGQSDVLFINQSIVMIVLSEIMLAL